MTGCAPCLALKKHYEGRDNPEKENGRAIFREIQFLRFLVKKNSNGIKFRENVYRHCLITMGKQKEGQKGRNSFN